MCEEVCGWIARFFHVVRREIRASEGSAVCVCVCVCYVRVCVCQKEEFVLFHKEANFIAGGSAVEVPWIHLRNSSHHHKQQWQ